MQGQAIVRHVVTFGRVLREVGIEVGPGRDCGRRARARRSRSHAAGRRLLHSPPDPRLAPRRARALRPGLRRVVHARAGRSARAAEADTTLRGSSRQGHARVGRRRRRGGRLGRSARARGLRPRAPSREGLRGDDSRGVRAGAPPDGRDRQDAASTHVAASLGRSARRRARPPPALPQVAAHGG